LLIGTKIIYRLGKHTGGAKNKVLRRMHERKKEEVTGWRRLHNKKALSA
jgi:hypothetical protein